MSDKATIHIAPDISYLFSETAPTAKALCGKLVCGILESGEFVGIEGNLNADCAICEECRRKADA